MLLHSITSSSQYVVSGLVQAASEREHQGISMKGHKVSVNKEMKQFVLLDVCLFLQDHELLLACLLDITQILKLE